MMAIERAKTYTKNFILHLGSNTSEPSFRSFGEHQIVVYEKKEEVYHKKKKKTKLLKMKSSSLLSFMY